MTANDVPTAYMAETAALVLYLRSDAATLILADATRFMSNDIAPGEWDR